MQSLARGLAVIRAFDETHPRLTLSEVAQRTQLPRAAARRFLLTLTSLGYVESDGRLFALRPRVLDLGFAYLTSVGLPEIALPHLEQLVAEVQESSSMSVLDGADVVYIARVPTRERIMAVSISVGTRFPAHATSMGRVLLASLDETAREDYLARTKLERYTAKSVQDIPRLREILDATREQGYAIVDQELEDGLRSIAAPVHSANGSVVAAVNVSVHESRATLRTLRSWFLPRLLDTVKALDAELAVRGYVLPST